MAAEMEAYYREQLQLRMARAAEAPRELRELEARIARLRDRLERGDPDLTADELLVAIASAEGKRQELLQCQRASNSDQQPASKIDQGFSALFLI
jgi:hypothetical protein